VPRCVLPGEQGGSRRAAQRCGDVGVVESHTLHRQSIEHGRLQERHVARDAEMIRPVVITEDDEQIG
jgi:hypothetical protein